MMNLVRRTQNTRMVRNLYWLWSDYSVIFAFLAIIIMAVIVNGSDFASYNNLMNILRQVSIIGIISLGMTVVMLSGGIDLSVGAVLAFIGAITILALNKTGSVWVAVIAALAIGAGIGFLNGLLITKGRIASFIATLGAMAAARSLSLYIANGGSIAGDVQGYTSIANGKLFGVAFPIVFFLAITFVIYILMHHTKFGRYVYAIGSNEKAAILSAIRVDRVKIGVYMLCSALVGIAAIIESSRLNSISSASSGISYELDAIAAVIIGGTRMTGGRGKVVGTLFGVLILGVLNNTMNLIGVSPYLQGLVKGLIIIVAVLLQKKD